jgi:hypothetical protein
VNHVERVLEHAADFLAAAPEVVMMMVVVMVVTHAASFAVRLEGGHVSRLGGLPETLREPLRQITGAPRGALGCGRELFRNLLRDFLESRRILLRQLR